MYLNDWSCKADVERDFGLAVDSLQHVRILLASYTYIDYSGSAFVLFEENGKLYEVNGSHCSCNGLENQWEPEETSVEALNHRLSKGPLGGCENIGPETVRDVLFQYTQMAVQCDTLEDLPSADSVRQAVAADLPKIPAEEVERGLLGAVRSAVTAMLQGRLTEQEIQLKFVLPAETVRVLQMRLNSGAKTEEAIREDILGHVMTLLEGPWLKIEQKGYRLDNRALTLTGTGKRNRLAQGDTWTVHVAFKLSL